MGAKPVESIGIETHDILHLQHVGSAVGVIEHGPVDRLGELVKTAEIGGHDLVTGHLFPVPAVEPLHVPDINKGHGVIELFHTGGVDAAHLEAVAPDGPRGTDEEHLYPVVHGEPQHPGNIGGDQQLLTPYLPSHGRKRTDDKMFLQESGIVIGTDTFQCHALYRFRRLYHPPLHGIGGHGGEARQTGDGFHERSIHRHGVGFERGVRVEAHYPDMGTEPNQLGRHLPLESRHDRQCKYHDGHAYRHGKRGDAHHDILPPPLPGRDATGDKQLCIDMRHDSTVR